MSKQKQVSDWVCVLMMLVAFACGWLSNPAYADDYMANKNKVIKAEAKRRAETSTGMTYQQHKRQVAQELRSIPYKAYTNPATKQKLEEIKK
jgi:hypothetical protein